MILISLFISAFTDRRRLQVLSHTYLAFWGLQGRREESYIQCQRMSKSWWKLVSNPYWNHTNSAALYLSTAERRLHFFLSFRQHWNAPSNILCIWRLETSFIVKSSMDTDSDLQFVPTSLVGYLARSLNNHSSEICSLYFQKWHTRIYTAPEISPRSDFLVNIRGFPSLLGLADISGLACSLPHCAIPLMLRFDFFKESANKNSDMLNIRV